MLTAAMVPFLAATEIGELSAGLGVIAAAVIVGQVLVYRFVFKPDQERSIRLLEDAQRRAAKTLEDEQLRSAASLANEQNRAAAAILIERERSNRLEAELREQNKTLQDKALPALIAATAATIESQALIRDLNHEKELAQRDLDRRAQKDRDKIASRLEDDSE